MQQIQELPEAEPTKEVIGHFTEWMDVACKKYKKKTKKKCKSCPRG